MAKKSSSSSAVPSKRITGKSAPDKPLKSILKTSKKKEEESKKKVAKKDSTSMASSKGKNKDGKARKSKEDDKKKQTSKKSAESQEVNPKKTVQQNETGKKQKPKVEGKEPEPKRVKDIGKRKEKSKDKPDTSKDTSNKKEKKERNCKSTGTDKASPCTPLKNNAALCGTPSTDTSSHRGASVEGDLSDLENAKKEAAKKGISLENYMLEESAAAIEKKMEEHMKKVADQHAQELLEEEEAGEDDEDDEEEEEEEGEEDDEVTAGEDLPEEKAGSKEEEGEEDGEDESKGSEEEGSEENSHSDDEGSSSSEEDEDGEAEVEAEAEEEEEAPSSKPKKVSFKDEPEPGDPKALALVAVSEVGEKASQAAAASAMVPTSPNSSTHKNEWNMFNRQCMDKKKFPAQLATHFLSSKLNLFAEWLKAGGDWDKVSLVFERKVKESNKVKRGRKGMKERDIKATYGEKKTKELLTRLKARGLFEADEDFPDDEEEIWWFVGQGGEVSKETEVTETTGVKVKDKAPDKNMVMALTSDEGPLAAGAVPKIGNMCETGEKNLYESLNKHTAAPKKRARQPRTSEEEPKAEEMIPKTPKDQVKEMKEGVLTNATAARKYALSLKHLNYSGELVQGLMNFSQKMESLFDKITELLNNPSAGDDRFIKIKSYIERNAEWYTQAEAAAKGLLGGLESKKSKTRKRKAKPAEGEEK